MMAEHVRFVEARSLFDVSLDEELAASSEQARDLLEHVGPQHEPLRVALFPPGIRKVEKHGGERAVGAEPRKGEARVLGEHATPIGQTRASEALVDDHDPLAFHFEAEEAHRGGGLEPPDQKSAAPRPDFELVALASTREERAHVDLVAGG